MNSDRDLHLIAQHRWQDPLNTWPDHNGCHRRTLLGEWLFDFACLRCWLEKVATEQLRKRQEEQPDVEVLASAPKAIAHKK